MDGFKRKGSSLMSLTVYTHISQVMLHHASLMQGPTKVRYGSFFILMQSHRLLQARQTRWVAENTDWSSNTKYCAVCTLRDKMCRRIQILMNVDCLDSGKEVILDSLLNHQTNRERCSWTTRVSTLLIHEREGCRVFSCKWSLLLSCHSSILMLRQYKNRSVVSK